MSSRRSALVVLAFTALVLAVMVAISIATGATQEAHEHYQPPADYAASLLAHPGPLRALFGLDIAFLVLYTGFFAALAKYLHELRRPFAWIAFAVMATVAALDVVEDHHILSLLAIAEHGRPIDDGAIAFQDVLSQTKFSLSYLALFLFGLAIPRTTKLGWALSLFLTAGNLATAVLNVGAPTAWRESLDGGRWIGFLAGFALAGAWLRTAPDPE